MSQLYILRHAQKDDHGVLTVAGEHACREIIPKLPKFSKVVTSDSLRAIRTAELITGITPEISTAAGFYMATKTKSDTINAMAADNGTSFLEAAVKFNDQEVNAGIETKARELNTLINSLLLQPDKNILLISHDLSISPAMKLREIGLESVGFLEGYIIDEDGTIKRYPNISKG